MITTVNDATCCPWKRKKNPISYLLTMMTEQMRREMSVNDKIISLKRKIGFYFLR